MAAIQNDIVLCVGLNGQLVPGSEPTNRLYRNDINRNIFWVVTPFSWASIVKGTFASTDLARQATTIIGKPTTIKGRDVVSVDKSYYELVKDWNVFKILPTQTILTKFPSTGTGTVAMGVVIKELEPKNPAAGFTKLGTIILHSQEVTFNPTLKQFYEVKTTNYEWNGFVLNFGDLLVNNEGLYLVIKPMYTRAATAPILFYGNPALEDDDFESVSVGDLSLLESLIALEGENAADIQSLFDTYIDMVNDIALKVSTSDIVDNLTSTDTDKPLSANQGKVLNEKIKFLDADSVHFNLPLSTYGIENKIENNDFSSGSDNWYLRDGYGGTLTVIDGIMNLVIANGFGGIQQNIQLTADNKFYIGTYAKGSANTYYGTNDTQFNFDSTNFKLYSNITTSYQLNNLFLIRSSVAETILIEKNICF